MPELSTTKFKNASGRRYTKALFFETIMDSDKSTAVYTLKDQDHAGLPSLNRLYLELADPTEYLYATKYLEVWEHWQELCACVWFEPYVDRWRVELELKLKAEALARIKAEARSTSKNAFTANKLLLDGGWIDKGSRAPGKVGRPSTAAVKAKEATLKLESNAGSPDEHYQRILEELTRTVN